MANEKGRPDAGGPLWIRIVCDPDDPNDQYVRVYQAATEAGLDAAAAKKKGRESNLSVCCLRTADITPTHDAAGNLTYDGLYQYTCDAWNRMVKTSRAYRDPDTGNLAVGSTVQTARYDGLGRPRRWPARVGGALY